MKQNAGGFTIVELLIVIVVIAVLAAISIVSYAGVQNRTNDTIIQADLKSIATKLEVFKVDNSAYPNSLADLANVGIEVSKEAYAVVPQSNFNLPYCRSAGASNFIVLAKSKSGNIFAISNLRSLSDITSEVVWDDVMTESGAMCAGLVSGSSALSHGYYSGDPALWRSWTNAD